MKKTARKPKSAKAPIPAKWRKLLALLPGYDSSATAGNCWFDARAADYAIEFIETCLTHVKGEKGNQPFLLESWQKGLIGALFGWKRTDGTRRYRESLIYIPRKNGKSALCAAIILLIMFLDKEPGAELYSAAASADQALMVFDQAKGMIEQENELLARCDIHRATKTVFRPDTKSFYKAVSSDAGKNHGKNVHAAIIDELHEQPNRDLVDAFCTSTGARRQPLIIYITTADYDRESICNEKRDYAIKVRDGIIDDDKFLPIIYEASNEEDWTDPKVWQKANPNLGVSVSLEYLQAECKKAQEIPTYENTFKRLHLNIKTTSDVVWLPLIAWDKCGELPFELERLEGRKCYGGLDLAATTDVAALALVFPPLTEKEFWLAVLKFWIPSDSAHQRERRDRVPYVTWARQGHITMTDGNVIDQRVIRRDINALRATYNIRKIGIDRWNAAAIITELTGDGFDMVEYGQGFASMNAPAKELEKSVISCKFAHGKNPVLRWMASNCMIEEDSAGNIKPSKGKSIEKIDGIVSVVMAIGITIAEPQHTSVYESRGIKYLDEMYI